MERLPEIKTLKEVIVDILKGMSVGEIREYDTANRNFVSFRQTLYEILRKEKLGGEWMTKMNRKENVLTIVRIK